MWLGCGLSTGVAFVCIKTKILSLIINIKDSKWNMRMSRKLIKTTTFISGCCLFVVFLRFVSET